MEVTVEAKAVGQREPSLGDVLLDLWRARWFVMSGLLIAGMACFFFLATAVPHYKTEMIIAPTTRSGTPDISAMFPGNASFAMEYVLKSFGPGDSSDFMRFETILKQPTVAAKLIDDEIVLKGVREARRFDFAHVKMPQTAEELSLWLDKNIKIENIPATRLKRLALLHPDGAFGRYLLHKLYAETDMLIRNEVVDKTARRVLWLKDQIQITAHPEHRRILTDLLMDQEQISMILAVDEPYAAMIAEPASVSPKVAWPRRGLAIPLFLLVGMFVGYMGFSLRRSLKAA